MKTSAVLLMTLVTLTFLGVTLAGKGHRGRNRKDGCRYDRKSGTWSECDSASNKRTKTMTLKPGQASSCEPTKTIEKPCNRDRNPKANKCRYDRKSGSWSKCDPATKTKTKTIMLKSDQPANCEPTKTITKQCTGGGKQKCRYDRQSGSWSVCDPATNRKTKAMTLKAEQSADCKPTKIIEKTCNKDRGIGHKKKCRYNRRSGNWSECDPNTNKKTKVMRLKPGQPSSCEKTKTIEKSCSLGKDGEPGKRCRYDRRSGTWSECDRNTNKRKKVMTLKPGQPSNCEQTKVVEETCTPDRGIGHKKKCRYNRRSGNWSECDPNTNKKTKVMRLKPGQPSSCEKTKTIEKSCSLVEGQEAGCKYERQVSECVDNQKTISFILVSGGEQCRPKEPKQKPCQRRDQARNEKKAQRKARRKERRNQRKNDGQS